jgi:hypothetical protein
MVVYPSLVVFGLSTKPPTMTRLFAELFGHYPIHTHVVIAFQRDQMIENGKTIVAPFPDGVSGGAVWKRYPNSDQRKLAAIAIEYRRNCLIGTRISAVLEYIRIALPHLTFSIPRPTDLGVDFQILRGGVPLN